MSLVNGKHIGRSAKGEKQMETREICMSGIANNKRYLIGGKIVNFPPYETLLEAGKNGKLFVVISHHQGSEKVITRVIANTEEQALQFMYEFDGPSWEHAIKEKISIAPDPTWYAGWSSLVNHFSGIENLRARVGAYLAENGTTEEQAWIGRALVAIGDPAKRIISKVKALKNRGPNFSEVYAEEIAPFCQPANEEMFHRTSEFHQYVSGEQALIAKLSPLAEKIVRIQISAGKVTPFHAHNAIGQEIDWTKK